jgi:N-dimethylarginine dimethylaminohydrolase
MMSNYAKQMLDDTLHELSMKGDCVMDFYDSMCIIRLRQVIEWSLEEMWRIKERKEVTDTMWEDYAELVADVNAAKRMLEYFGASYQEESNDD